MGALLINQLRVNVARASVLLAVLALSVGTLGCGGDAEDGSAGTPAAGTGSGGAAGSATGGSGATSGASGASGSATGTGGSGGMTATGGAGGFPAPMAVPCGTATCEPDPMASLLQSPCCVDEATATCGTMIPIIGMCAEPVDPDPRCESLMIMNFEIPSCCTPDNRCGIASAMFSAEPCTAIEDITAMFATPDGGTEDGGTPDGGGMMMGGMGNPFAGALPEPKACE